MTHQRTVWNRRSLSRGLASAVLVVLFPLAALAGFVYSTWNWQTTLDHMLIFSHGDFHCGEGRSAMGTSSDPGEVWGYVRSKVDPGTGCAGSLSSVPAGYLAAATRGWYDPDNNGTFSLCGETGFAYSAVTTYSFGVGAALCPNPSGADEYYAQARPRHGYDSGAGTYYKTGVWSHNSPMQSY